MLLPPHPSALLDRCRVALYLWRTRAAALYALATLTEEDVDRYYDSYILFEGDWSNRNGKQESHIVDYYNVLKHLCALGNVGEYCGGGVVLAVPRTQFTDLPVVCLHYVLSLLEKMYIPPLLDKNAGVYRNQLIFERKMMADIGLLSSSAENGRKKVVLDVGCGAGRIALHVAQASGAFVCGINLDPSQVASAQDYAQRIGLTDRTDFRVASFNDALPFADETFDAIHNVQAFSYAKDKNALFRELYRVLKPGCKFTLLEWVLKDNYDPDNPEHVEHIRKTMPFIGAVDTIHYTAFEDAIKRAGFRISFSQDISIDGHQAPLIEKERQHYAWLRTFARHFLPQRFSELLARLKLYVQHFVDADETGIATTSWQIICEKPPGEC